MNILKLYSFFGAVFEDSDHTAPEIIASTHRAYEKLKINHYIFS